jgi:hypothetical protein
MSKFTFFNFDSTISLVIALSHCVSECQQKNQTKGKKMQTKRHFKEISRMIPRNKLPHINIITQMRKELPDTKKLQELGASIVSMGGNLNPILIVRIKGRQQAQVYVDFFACTYGSRPGVFDYTPDHEDVYFFLLAGHCRWVSIKPLSIQDVPKIKITIFVPKDENNTAYHAVLIQQAENVSNPPSAEVQADAIAAIWNAHKIAYPERKLSFAALAVEIGRSAETVSRALRWRGLREEIRIQVVSGELAFGAGIELGRLFDAIVKGERLFSDDFVFAKMRSVQSNATPVVKLKREIDSLIQHNTDVANKADFFLATGMSIPELLAHEARSASGAHQTMLRHQVGRMKQYATIVAEHPELLKSEMGALYEGNTRDLFILYLEHIEEVAKLLHKRGQIDDMKKARASKATKRIRAAMH